MRLIATIAGIVAVLLGGLWLIQGTGLVTIPPILCLAECEPVVGGSLPWAITGAVVLAGGLAALGYAWRKRGQPHLGQPRR